MLDYRVETFLAICRTGSFTQAARELQITQPAVSQHVRILERHYGCALFAHEGRSVRLTPEGMLLHRSLATMSADARRLRRSVSSLDGQSEPLRFGATRTVAEHVMPRVLPSWGLSHPDRRLSMRVGNTQDLLGLIERERIEFALVEGSFDSRPYDSVPFSSEEFIAVGPVGAYPATSIRDLAGTPLVLREPGSGTREDPRAPPCRQEPLRGGLRHRRRARERRNGQGMRGGRYGNELPLPRGSRARTGRRHARRSHAGGLPRDTRPLARVASRQHVLGALSHSVRRVARLRARPLGRGVALPARARAPAVGEPKPDDRQHDCRDGIAPAKEVEG